MVSSDEREPNNRSTTGAPTTDSPVSGESVRAGVNGDADGPLLQSGLGSGLLAQQPTPTADEAVAVAKVCPQCGGEYETGDRFCPKDGSPLRPKAGGDPLVGRVIADRYLILALLGEGGMGRVYLAEHVKMNRQCAIKVMNPSLVNDTESSQRFAREASNAARILHPNVAAVFDYGEADKVVYLVMEYVDGESLSTILSNDGALDPRRAIDLGRQIADGLATAHELGIVHRDLKPDNVIVAHSRSGKEIPKVVDFGIAKAISETPQDSLTRSGLVIGTPEYMSPEQLLGDPIDARSDIYSLGCILYQMLTGKPAFEAESREQMIRRRLHEAPPHVRDVLPSLPRRLDTLIVHMLARSPNDRLGTAAEAREALDPALALGGWDPKMITVQRPTPRMSIQAANASRVPSDPSLRPTIPMPRQRATAGRVITGTLVGAVMVAGGFALWSAQQPAPPSPKSPVDSSAGSTPPSAAVLETTVVKPPVAAPTPPKVAHAPAKHAAPKPVAPVDTTALNALNAHLHDSIANARKDSLEYAAETAPLWHLAAAVQQGDSARLARAYPSLSPSQLQFFQKTFVTMVPKSLKVTPIAITRYNASADHAEASFKLQLEYFAKGGASKSSNPTEVYTATLDRRGGQWILTDLKTPD